MIRTISLIICFFCGFHVAFASDTAYITQIRERLNGERLLTQTKEAIREPEKVEYVPKYSLNVLYEKLHTMNNYYSRKGQDTPPIMTILIAQEGEIKTTDTPGFQKFVELYTLDRWFRYEKAREYEHEQRINTSKKVYDALPENTVVPDSPISKTAQSLVVDLSDQRLYAFEEGVLIYSTLITSGRRGFKTIIGDFHVTMKKRNKALVSPFKDPALSYRYFVDYWIQFHPRGYGLHDSCNSKNCWRTKFGGPDYLTRGSHGCINMPYDAVKWLYDWISPESTVKIVP